MKLKTLIKDISFEAVKGSKEIEIAGLCSHSKWVSPGSLFIARRGLSYDGSRFIEDAIKSGAVAILTDIYNPFLPNITQLIDRDVVQKEIALASKYYQEPSKELFLVGITGTNGKTTTSYLIRHLLGESSCGLIGTVEYIIGNQRFPSTLTTPDIIQSQKMLRDMVSKKLTSAVMEVSSHALIQRRVEGLEFDVAIFTQLTQDHLDYHGTMEEYAKAKQILFKNLKSSSYAIINVDSPYAEGMKKATKAKIITYGIDTPCDIWARNVSIGIKGTSFTLCITGKEYEVTTKLVGRFNVYNILAGITAALCQGIKIENILERLKSFTVTCGRLEPVENTKGYSIYVDYAHTPDALENVLSTLKPMTEGKVVVVFGCGGNRDAQKRPLMGAVAEKIADRVIVTSDNPRSENPGAIVEDILKGFKHPKKVDVIIDRREAIIQAIKSLDSKDVLLIAGKGHEKKQIFNDRVIDFDDKEIAQHYLEAIC